MIWSFAGHFVPDIIVGAMVGLVVGWCFGPLAPIVSHWLAKTSILHGFLQITVVAMAISSQVFPYSTGAPKRVVLQHTFVTGLILLGLLVRKIIINGCTVF